MVDGVREVQERRFLSGVKGGFSALGVMEHGEGGRKPSGFGCVK